MKKFKIEKGDIIYDKMLDTFNYIDSVLFECKSVELTFIVIGHPFVYKVLKLNTKKLASDFIRYGKASDIGMTDDTLNSYDITIGDTKEQGLRKQRLNREIKLKFLQSY